MLLPDINFCRIKNEKFFIYRIMYPTLSHKDPTPPRATNQPPTPPPPQVKDPTPPPPVSQIQHFSPLPSVVFYSKRAVSISLSVDIIAVFVIHRGTTSLNSFSFSLSVDTIAVIAVHGGTTALNSFSISRIVGNNAVSIIHILRVSKMK